MLDIIFVLLFIMAFLLMLYAIMERNTAFCVIDAVMWFILALFMLQGIEIPYQGYNVSSTAVYTGVQTIQTNLTPLSYLFMGLGTIMFIIFVTFAMEYLTDYNKMKNK